MPHVQVMALLAYLMEHKNNYGPHLIIVPNALMVNWKSELNQWLPSVRCVYYVGQKEERARKFAQEVSSLQFNVLVTTYEYIMRDRAKLSKVSNTAKCADIPKFLIIADCFIHNINYNSNNNRNNDDDDNNNNYRNK